MLTGEIRNQRAHLPAALDPVYQAGYDFKRLFAISEIYDRDCAAFYSVLQQVREAGVTSPTAGSRRLLFTRLACEGPVQPVGGYARRVRQPGRDASIAGIRRPLG